MIPWHNKGTLSKKNYNKMLIVFVNIETWYILYNNRGIVFIETGYVFSFISVHTPNNYINTSTGVSVTEWPPSEWKKPKFYLPNRRWSLRNWNNCWVVSSVVLYGWINMSTFVTPEVPKHSGYRSAFLLLSIFFMI